MKKPRPLSEEELCAQKALTQLSGCTSTIRDLENAIRAMVDDVIIVTTSGDRLDILMTWESGQERADELYMFLLAIQEEAIDFTSHDFFDKLDGRKKAEYVDAISAIQRDMRKLHSQYRYFLLIYHIEQTEQTIALLWNILHSQCNSLLAGQLNESIEEHELPGLRKNIQLTRARLSSETQKVLEQIQALTKREHFLDMETEKRNEYYAKWRLHQEGIPDISMD